MTGSPTDEKKKFALNAVSSGVSNIIRVTVQLLLLPILARLVGPKDFGVYALATPIIAFFTVIADGGLGSSLARVDERETAVWSTAFWTSAAFGLFISGLVIVIGIGMAFALDDLRVGEIIAVLSLSFTILSFGILPNARLVRRGRLVIHNLADVISTILGAIGALALASAGAGAWSLVAQAMISIVCRTIILNMFGFVRPDLRFDLGGLTPHLVSGGSMIGARLSEFFGRLCENMIVSFFAGNAALGGLSFAHQAAKYVVDLFGNTLWGSLYSHSLRSNKEESLQTYLKLSRLLALILLPIAFISASVAPEIFALALGAKWIEAGYLFQIIIPFYALYTLSSQVGAVMYAYGMNKIIFTSAVVYSLSRVVGTAVVPWYGVAGAAWGVGLSSVVYAIWMFRAQEAVAPTSSLATLKGFVVPFGSALVGAAVSYALCRRLPDLLYAPVAAGVVGAMTYAALVLIFDRTSVVGDIRGIVRIVRR